MSHRLSIAFLCVGLVACASPRSGQSASTGSTAALAADECCTESSSEDCDAHAQDSSAPELVKFGPAPDQPEHAVRSWFESYLSHPDLAEFELAEPEQGYYGTAEACRTGEGLRFAWLITAQVRETDADSGATQVRTFHCWFQADELLAVFEPARLDPEYGISASLRED